MCPAPRTETASQTGVLGHVQQEMAISVKFSTISIALISLAVGLIFFALIGKPTRYAWVCPADVTEQHRAFVIACAMHSGQGVSGCTNDADQLFCTKQEISK